MGNMFADVLEPKIELGGFHLVLASLIVAIGELPAQEPQILFHGFQRMHPLGAILQKVRNFGFRRGLFRLQMFDTTIQRIVIGS
jgi:hypothetical protein